MSLKKIEDIKSNKFFKVWDILVYAILAVVIVALFLSVFLTSDKSPLSGVGVYYASDYSSDYSLVFYYSFENDKYTILYSDMITVENDNDAGITVNFCVEEKGWHNTIYIDKSATTVAVIYADCVRKDCTLTTIKDKSGIIICASHGLKIIPDDYDDGDDGKTLQ